MANAPKRIVILPYFGKFNAYFKLWLQSCANNKSIDWLIVTDCDFSFEEYTNIKAVNTTLARLKEDFQKKFDFKISLKTPYKLCDYKPIYGFLFSEYTNGYDYCGYCDCDLVFGDIDAFLDTELFDIYDKILRNGHLSFIKNTPEVNEVFKKYDTYKVVFSSPAIYNYDEAISGFRPGFAWELLENGGSLYQNESLVADIKYTNFPFYTVANPTEPCVFSYENGKTYRIVKNGEGIEKTEVMYFHLQKRKMEVNTDFSSGSYLIYPNNIVDYDPELLQSDAFWEHITTEVPDYFDPSTERKDLLKRDVVRFIHEPKKIKSLVHRFTKY